MATTLVVWNTNECNSIYCSRLLWRDVTCALPTLIRIIHAPEVSQVSGQNVSQLADRMLVSPSLPWLAPSLRLWFVHACVDGVVVILWCDSSYSCTLFMDTACMLPHLHAWMHASIMVTCCCSKHGCICR